MVKDFVGFNSHYYYLWFADVFYQASFMLELYCGEQSVLYRVSFMAVAGWVLLICFIDVFIVPEL